MPRNRMIFFGGIAAFLLLLFGLSQFFQSIQAEAWSEERQAAETAYQKTVMVKADKVNTFVGEKIYKIVYGTDAIGQPMIVWISDDEIHTEYAADGLKDKELRTQFALKEPEAKLLRILPGKFKDMFVWELYYDKPDAEGKTSYYYDYIGFKDGAWLDTYNLGRK